MANPIVHLLDVGTAAYGDCLVLQLPGAKGATRWVLVDAGHRGDAELITNQLDRIRGAEAPHLFDLILISHAHDDHIGAMPKLVTDGTITAKWALVPDPTMAFGEDDPTDAADAPEESARISAALAVLREEPLTFVDSSLDSAAINAALLDAARQRDRYSDMLARLTADKTKLVRFGNDKDSATQAKLIKAFADVGMNVLGPNHTTLAHTAELLQSARNAIVDAIQGAPATDAAATTDPRGALANAIATVDSVDLGALTASVDGTGRAGHLVNAQSVVCTFTAGATGKRARLLMGGDFQFADLGTTDAVIVAERDRLVSEIRKGGPYAFVKLSHHGSPNGVDAKLLDVFTGPAATAPKRGTVVGISAGRGHSKHPDAAVLQMLSDHDSTLDWVRTDRVGHVSVELRPTGVTVLPAASRNDSEPNQTDAAATSEPAEQRLLSKAGHLISINDPGGVQSHPTSATNGRQLVIDVPAQATSVDIHIEFGATQQDQDRSTTERPVAGVVPTATADDFEIGGGRSLGALNFVTDTGVLAQHIDGPVVSRIVNAIRAGGYGLCDLADPGRTVTIDAAAAKERVHRFLESTPAPRMVILGGYDVVPAHRVDALPSDLPADDVVMLRKGDPDQFFVWSDDPFVDLDGAGFPDIAFSRVPDGHDTLFTMYALQATPSPHDGRVGIRNVKRPFVDAIFSSLPGQQQIDQSAPKTTADVTNPFAAPLAYVMLHGKSSDGTKFWGESAARDYLEAFSLSQIPTEDLPHDELDVVLLGCCWGALGASTPAFSWDGLAPIAGRLPAQSIAFSMLGAGARGVVGCTGAHYSPIEVPFNQHSGPLHQAFWASILAGAAPADALYNAKTALARHIVTLSDVTDIAIASKTLAQFTCLGLGW